MPDYSFLVGKRDSQATFWPEDADEKIAEACDWVPIAWLALFKSDDVVLVEERPDDGHGERQGFPSEPLRSCGTLIAERRSALENLARRITRLERALPADLLQRVRALEAAVRRSRSPYIQVLVTDIDLYVSSDDSADLLRKLVATMDSDDVDQWRVALSFVHAKIGSSLGEISFPKAREAAVIGYLSDSASTSEPGTRLFTRNAQFAEGWRSLVRPLYLKVFVGLLVVVILILGLRAA